MKYEALIVGAGLTGITLARRLAEQNVRVLIVEKRNHIGGDCYDYRDHNGILIHRYGPHIFRTDSEEVFSFLSRFTKWYDYQHKVLSYVGGSFYPMPINLDTVNKYLNTCYTSDTLLSYFEQVRVPVGKPTNVKEVIESQVGEKFYHAFFEHYTQKQWGCDPVQLPPSIVARIPIRTSRDDRYFTVKYQGIPTDGYTVMMQRMLDHPNISIMLQADFRTIKNECSYQKLYYTGSIDEYFDFCYGRLPYRCVHFQFEEYDCKQYQPVAVVNYPNDYGYTRVTEFKHFLPTNATKTVIAKEFSSDTGSPSYPIPTDQNIALLKKYQRLAEEKEPKTVFAGRLGTYRYYSMDQIVKSALDIQL